MHEFFHGLGLDHPPGRISFTRDDNGKRTFEWHYGKTRIITPRATRNYSPPFRHPQTIKPDARSIQQEDVDEAVKVMKGNSLLNRIFNSYDSKDVRH